MGNDFDEAFKALRGMFADLHPKLNVSVDSDKEYTLHTRVASPLPQYKGAPVYFAGVRKGKAYVSLHLFPLYVHAELKETISPDLKKRMQGLTCFNFKTVPDAKQLVELKVKQGRTRGVQESEVGLAVLQPAKNFWQVGFLAVHQDADAINAR